MTEDRVRFSEAACDILRSAVFDLSFLLSRTYAERAALALVGDRYQLDARQRTAVRRCAASEQSIAKRAVSELRQVDGQTMLIDGFNLLMTIEVALSGGVLLEGRDGCIRDLAGASRRPKKETVERGLAMVREATQALGVSHVHWLFDQPISKSGEVRAEVEARAEAEGWGWKVEVVPDPDPILSVTELICVTADSAILDRCAGWFNLIAFVVARSIPDAKVLRLR